MVTLIVESLHYIDVLEALAVCWCRPDQWQCEQTYPGARVEACANRHIP
jgi:hypothetical protein